MERKETVVFGIVDPHELTVVRQGLGRLPLIDGPPDFGDLLQAIDRADAAQEEPVLKEPLVKAR